MSLLPISCRHELGQGWVCAQIVLFQSKSLCISVATEQLWLIPANVLAVECQGCEIDPRPVVLSSYISINDLLHALI